MWYNAARASATLLSYICHATALQKGKKRYYVLCILLFTYGFYLAHFFFIYKRSFTYPQGFVQLFHSANDVVFLGASVLVLGLRSCFHSFACTHDSFMNRNSPCINSSILDVYNKHKGTRRSNAPL